MTLTRRPSGVGSIAVVAVVIAPRMIAMDITIHSTFERVRLLRCAEALRNG
jgi:hypothetical protein